MDRLFILLINFISLIMKFNLIKKILIHIFHKISHGKKSEIIKSQLNFVGLKSNEQMISKIEKSLVKTIINTIYFSNKKSNYYREKIKINREKELIEYFKSNNSIICSSHYSNWELLLQRISLSIPNIILSAKPQKHKETYKFIVSLREKFGAKVLSKENVIKHFLTALKEGKNIFFLGDQSSDSKNGILVPFFLKGTYFLKTAGLLSYKMKKDIVYIYIRNIKDTVEYIVDWEVIPFNETLYKNLTKEEYIESYISKYVFLLETTIKEKPEEWMWQHKKWKQTHPILYI